MSNRKKITMKEASEYDFVFHTCEDKTVNNLIHKFSSRAIESNKKHGDKIHEVQKPIRQWVVEGLEEAMDLCVYLQRAIEKIDEESEGI